MLAARRQVFDVATTGNPALQKTDVIRVEDAKVGTARNWQIDTYVTEMEAGGLLPRHARPAAGRDG